MSKCAHRNWRFRHAVLLSTVAQAAAPLPSSEIIRSAARRRDARRCGGPLFGHESGDLNVANGSAAPVQLTKMTTYRVHRLSIRTKCPWVNALENCRVRSAVERWRLYFETGHRRRDFLIARMTGSGRLASSVDECGLAEDSATGLFGDFAATDAELSDLEARWLVAVGAARVPA
jgi:hypothetical protein